MTNNLHASECFTAHDTEGLAVLPVGVEFTDKDGDLWTTLRDGRFRHPFYGTTAVEWLGKTYEDGSSFGPFVIENPSLLGEFFPTEYVTVEDGQTVRLVVDVDCYGLRAGDELTIQEIREPVVGSDFGIDYDDVEDGATERGYLHRDEFEIVDAVEDFLDEPLADWERELLNGSDALIYRKGDRVTVDYKAQSESARNMWNGPATVTHDFAGATNVRVQPDGHKYPGAFAPADVSPLVETEETDSEPLVCGFSYDELAVLTQAFKLLAKASGVPIVVAWPVADLAA